MLYSQSHSFSLRDRDKFRRINCFYYDVFIAFLKSYICCQKVIAFRIDSAGDMNSVLIIIFTKFDLMRFDRISFHHVLIFRVFILKHIRTDQVIKPLPCFFLHIELCLSFKRDTKRTLNVMRPVETAIIGINSHNLSLSLRISSKHTYSCWYFIQLNYRQGLGKFKKVQRHFTKKKQRLRKIRLFAPLNAVQLFLHWESSVLSSDNVSPTNININPRCNGRNIH